MNIHMNKTFAGIAGLGAFVLLAGCGQSGLSGTYVDPSGNVSLNFEPGGKVTYHASETGFTERDTYTINDKKVTIKSTRGTVGILVIQSDGCLRSPTMGTLCKPKHSS